MKNQKVIHVAFYFSERYASEYLASYEQYRLLSKYFCVDLISSNLEFNSFTDIPLEKVIVVDSLLSNQNSLYRWTDVFPQIIWHFKVYRLLKKLQSRQKVLVSAMMPWLPSFLYGLLKHDVVFLGVGGSRQVLSRSVKEILRFVLSIVLLKLFERNSENIKVVPRTVEASDLWRSYAYNITRVVPERVNPVSSVDHIIDQNDDIVMLWIGQDIPRKRMDLGLYWFNQLKNNLSTHLHVYGSKGRGNIEGVTFHGWVSSINFRKHGSKLVLLLSSEREGLPSAVVEVLQLGGLVVTRNVGSLSALKSDRVFVIADDENNWKEIAALIKQRFSSESVNVVSEDFSNLYLEVL